MTSTMAKHRAIAQKIGEVIWFQRLMRNLHEEFEHTIAHRDCKDAQRIVRIQIDTIV